MQFKLSSKYKDFLKYNDAELEILEGTTASGKTTTGIVKFLFKVAASNQKLHIISGQNLGIVEKNIINCELGILDIFGDSRHGGEIVGDKRLEIREGFLNVVDKCRAA